MAKSKFKFTDKSEKMEQKDWGWSAVKAKTYNRKKMNKILLDKKDENE
jgi:hypothetical protein